MTKRAMFHALLLLVTLASCSSKGVARGDADVPRVSEASARTVAEQKARDTGYDLGVYQIASAERTAADSHFKGAWRFSFVHLPPAPPGGHFLVYVDASTAEAKLLRGE